MFPSVLTSSLPCHFLLPPSYCCFAFVLATFCSKKTKENPIVLFKIATKQQLLTTAMEILGTCFSNQDDD